MERYPLILDRLGYIADVLDGPQDGIKVFLYPSAGSAGVRNTLVKTQNNHYWCALFLLFSKKTRASVGLFVSYSHLIAFSLSLL